MSEGSIVNVKSRLLDLLSELDEEELETIEQWIFSHSYKKDLESKKLFKKNEQHLIDIGNTIKGIVPLDAELPTETIVPPTIGDHSDCNKHNTRHIDEFLYDQDEVHDLVSKGKLKIHYCLECKSRNIKNLTLISHSMSRQVLQFIFNVLLPADLDGKQVLDIGSRLGAVIYGAYHFSNASNIVGVEMNKEWCDVQERIISEYSMDRNRISVINSDVMERSDVVQNSDIFVINNLDFFVDNEKHKQIWYFFKKYFKKGSYVVCDRSMGETLSTLKIFDELIDWLGVCKPQQPHNEIFFDIEDCCELFLYTVN